jgi:DNA-binding XRE family transcriptional regulator
MMSQEELRVRQEEMKRKHLAEREHPENLTVITMPNNSSPEVERTVCISCKHRLARVNSPYCSRCTSEGLTNQLRDTLPNVIKPVLKIEVLSTPFTPIEKVYHKPANGKKDAPPQNSESYTRSQAARIIGVSSTTLMRWERRGHIPQPMRVARNNECVYTGENIEAARKYMALEYHPEQVHTPAEPGTPATLASTVKKSVKVNKRLERVVATKIGRIGRLV